MKLKTDKKDYKINKTNNEEELFYSEAKILKEYAFLELVQRYKDGTLEYTDYEKHENYTEYTKTKIKEMLKETKKINEPQSNNGFKDRINQRIFLIKIKRLQTYLSKQDTRNLIEAFCRIKKYGAAIYHLDDNLNPYFIDMDANYLMPFCDNYYDYIYKMLKPKIKEFISQNNIKKEELKEGYQEDFTK